jgi:uncharacterized protein with FMN-binding domain
MKRALLIAGGTLGGLGAVMAITPPQFSSTESLALGGGAMGGSTPAAQIATAKASDSPTPAATKTKAISTKKATASKSATAAATASSNSNSGAVATADPTPTATKTTAAPAPASKGVTGTFTGPTVNVNYGNVQVQITVKDGKIVDATALQAPSGRNDRWTNMALPILKKQTLAAQGANIQGASGASYTSYGWYTSLQGALAKAGL